jgi:hypothetical protein
MTAYTPNILLLEHLKSRIEKMTKKQHIEILNILSKFANVKINENKSGVYINLLFLPENTVAELEKYIQYIEEQESTIMTVETQKNEYKNTYFTNKEDKEETALLL